MNDDDRKAAAVERLAKLYTVAAPEEWARAFKRYSAGQIEQAVDSVIGEGIFGNTVRPSDVLKKLRVTPEQIAAAALAVAEETWLKVENALQNWRHLTTSVRDFQAEAKAEAEGRWGQFWKRVPFPDLTAAIGPHAAQIYGNAEHFYRLSYEIGSDFDQSEWEHRRFVKLFVARTVAGMWDAEQPALPPAQGRVAKMIGKLSEKLTFPEKV